MVVASEKYRDGGAVGSSGLAAAIFQFPTCEKCDSPFTLSLV